MYSKVDCSIQQKMSTRKIKVLNQLEALQYVIKLLHYLT